MSVETSIEMLNVQSAQGVVDKCWCFGVLTSYVIADLI